ncbi:hypothetical protein CAPTEDRAFT_199368 [Capitella teleta]|uniref:Uncharacterized protein n=1 Tax=Capitella teleta TaxID=283909 RepID=R7UW69_CAPTE|nr:hypothetical protein CAPTEDRAFT_199368 [Capitella teleta]|eukprot:ELU10873.1 hypothetical protein CAPTEDRAFT_199368 [Capitella teleta]
MPLFSLSIFLRDCFCCWLVLFVAGSVVWNLRWFSSSCCVEDGGEIHVPHDGSKTTSLCDSIVKWATIRLYSIYPYIESSVCQSEGELVPIYSIKSASNVSLDEIDRGLDGCRWLPLPIR